MLSNSSLCMYPSAWTAEVALGLKVGLASDKWTVGAVAGTLNSGRDPLRLVSLGMTTALRGLREQSTIRKDLPGTNLARLDISDAPKSHTWAIRRR